MRINRLIIAMVILMSTSLGWAQDIDQERMDRDLKIAQDIVSSLIKNESDDGRFYAANPRATYIPGFGVMIDISTAGRFYSPSFDHSYNFVFSGDDEAFSIDLDEMVELEMQSEMLSRQAEEIERRAEIVARENERIAHEHKRALEEKERELEREMERLEREREREIEKIEREREREMERFEREQERRENGVREARVIASAVQNDDEYTYRYSYSNSDDDNYSDERGYDYEKRRIEKDFEDLKPMYRTVMTTFLSDYADLIGQLKQDEQVMLVTKGGSQSYGQIHFVSSSDGSGKFSGAASKKSMSDFKSGRISRDAFENSINFVESKATEKKAADLELFTSIFQRLYKTDLATTYYTSTPVSYERIKNFGVIYKMRLNTSTSMGRDIYRIATQKYTQLSRSERDRKVEQIYPQFLSELKGNILDYGKTIKSLESDDAILFQIRFSECNSCDIPKEINVLVKNQTLIDYESGRLSQSAALDQIKVNNLR